MRILLVNHGSAGEWGGGDGVQIRETGKRLQQRGHEGGRQHQPDCRGFDLVHLQPPGRRIAISKRPAVRP